MRALDAVRALGSPRAGDGAKAARADIFRDASLRGDARADRGFHCSNFLNSRLLSSSQDALGDALGALCALGPPRRAVARVPEPGRTERAAGGPSRRELARVALASLGPDSRGGGDFSAAQSLLSAAAGANLWLWDLLLDRCVEEALERREACLAVAAALGESLGVSCGPLAARERRSDDRLVVAGGMGRSARRAVAALARGVERFEREQKLQETSVERVGGSRGPASERCSSDDRAVACVSVKGLLSASTRASLRALASPLARFVLAHPGELGDTATARALAECLRGIAAVVRLVERKDIEDEQRAAREVAEKEPVAEPALLLLEALARGAQVLVAALWRPAKGGGCEATLDGTRNNDLSPVWLNKTPEASANSGLASPRASLPRPLSQSSVLSFPLQTRQSVFAVLFVLETLLDAAGRTGHAGNAVLAGVRAELRAGADRSSDLGAEDEAGAMRCDGGGVGGAASCSADDRAALYALLAAHAGLEAATCSSRALSLFEDASASDDGATRGGGVAGGAGLASRRPTVSPAGVAGVLRRLLGRDAREKTEAALEGRSSAPASPSSPPRSLSTSCRTLSSFSPARRDVPGLRSSSKRSGQRSRLSLPKRDSSAFLPGQVRTPGALASDVRIRLSIETVGANRVRVSRIWCENVREEDAESIIEGDVEREKGQSEQTRDKVEGKMSDALPVARSPPQQDASTSPTGRSSQQPSASPSYGQRSTKAPGNSSACSRASSSRFLRLPNGGLCLTLSRQHFPGRLIFPTSEGLAIAASVFGAAWFAELLAQPNDRAQKSRDAVLRVQTGRGEDLGKRPPASGGTSGTIVSHAATVRVYHRTPRSPVYVMGAGVVDLLKQTGARGGWRVHLSPGPAPGEAWVSVAGKGGAVDEPETRLSLDIDDKAAQADFSMPGKGGKAPDAEREVTRTNAVEVKLESPCRTLARAPPLAGAPSRVPRTTSAPVTSPSPTGPSSHLAPRALANLALPSLLAEAPPASFQERPPARETLASARSVVQTFFLPRGGDHEDRAWRFSFVPGLLAQAASLARRSGLGSGSSASRPSPSPLAPLAERLLALAAIRLFEPRADGVGLVARDEGAGQRRSSLSSRRRSHGSSLEEGNAEGAAYVGRDESLAIVRSLALVFDVQADGNKCSAAGKGLQTTATKRGSDAAVRVETPQADATASKRKRVVLAPIEAPASATPNSGVTEDGKRSRRIAPQMVSPLQGAAVPLAFFSSRPAPTTPSGRDEARGAETPAPPRRRISPQALSSPRSCRRVQFETPGSSSFHRSIEIESVAPTAPCKRTQPEAVAPPSTRKRIESQTLSPSAASPNPFFVAQLPLHASPGLHSLAPPASPSASDARRLLRTAMTSENPLEREAAWAAYIADKEAMLALMDDQLGSEAVNGDAWRGGFAQTLPDKGESREATPSTRPAPGPKPDAPSGVEPCAIDVAAASPAPLPSAGSAPTVKNASVGASSPPALFHAAHPDRAVATALAAELAWTGAGSPPAAWAALLGLASELLLTASRVPATRLPCDSVVAQRLASEAINAYDASLGPRARARVAESLVRDPGLALAAALALVRRGLGGDWARPGDVRGTAALATLRLAGAALRGGAVAKDGEEERDAFAREAVVPALLGCWPGAVDPLGVSGSSQGRGVPRVDERDGGEAVNSEDSGRVGSRKGSFGEVRREWRHALDGAQDQRGSQAAIEGESEGDAHGATPSSVPAPSPREETALLGARLWFFFVRGSSKAMVENSTPPPWAFKRLAPAEREKVSNCRSSSSASLLSLSGASPHPPLTRETCSDLLAAFIARATNGMWSGAAGKRGGSNVVPPGAPPPLPPDPLALRTTLDVAAAAAVASEEADLLALGSSASAAELTRTLDAALGACVQCLTGAEARLLKRLWGGDAERAVKARRKSKGEAGSGIRAGGAQGGLESADGSATRCNPSTGAFRFPSDRAPTPSFGPDRAPIPRSSSSFTPTSLASLPKSLEAFLRLGSAAAAFAVSLSGWLARAQARERDRASGRAALFSRARDPFRHLVCSPAAFDARVSAGADAAVALAGRVDALVRGSAAQSVPDAEALWACWSTGRGPLPTMHRDGAWLEGDRGGEGEKSDEESVSEESVSEESVSEPSEGESEASGRPGRSGDSRERTRYSRPLAVSLSESSRVLDDRADGCGGDLSEGGSKASWAARAHSRGRGVPRRTRSPGRSSRGALVMTSNGYLAAILRESRARSRRKKRANASSARGARARASASSPASSESEDASDLEDLEDFIVANPERDYDAFIAAHFPTRDEEEGAEEVWGPAAGEGGEGGEAERL